MSFPDKLLCDYRHEEKKETRLCCFLIWQLSAARPAATAPRVAITRLIITLTPTLTPKTLLSDIPAAVGGVKHRLRWSESTETPASRSRDDNKTPRSSSFVCGLLLQKQDEISEFLILDALPSYPHHILFPFGASCNTLEPF